MRALSLFIALLAAHSVAAQRPVALGPFIGENSAFDTLSPWYDRTDMSVDTTVAINDSLWMVVLRVSDADSMMNEKGEWHRAGGVCDFFFFMTIDPRLGWIKDYRPIRSDCDVEQSFREAVYYSHRVFSSNTVEVISSRAHYPEGENDWDELVPFETRQFKVLPTGMIADTGAGVILGGPTR